VTELKVIISGGFSGPYEKLVPEFERTTGIKVATGSGSSQGKGPQTIASQLAKGVPADVVILSREGLNELNAARWIAAGTDVDLARTPIGVAVRAGAPKPDVRSVEDFKRVVLKAKTVAVPSSTSGIFLIEEIFPRLGIADGVNVKATPRGSGAAAMVAAGEADIGLLPVSEIVHAGGVELAGVIAEEIQLHQIFAAAIVAGSKQIEAAKQLIAFLTSESAAQTIRRGGMEPPSTRSVA
jgi:molybdate transport system substrate-binding protein